MEKIKEGQIIREIPEVPAQPAKEVVVSPEEVTLELNRLKAQVKPYLGKIKRIEFLENLLSQVPDEVVPEPVVLEPVEITMSDGTKTVDSQEE